MLSTDSQDPTTALLRIKWRMLLILKLDWCQKHEAKISITCVEAEWNHWSTCRLLLTNISERTHWKITAEAPPTFIKALELHNSCSKLKMAPPTPPPLSPMDLFWQAPPFARYQLDTYPLSYLYWCWLQNRTLTALTLAISLLVHTNLLSGYWVVYYFPAFFKIPPQLWRLLTCFMLSGPKLSILFDPYFCEHCHTFSLPHYY